MITEVNQLLDTLKPSSLEHSSIQLQAWKMLQEVGLPSRKSEAYKFTPFTSIIEKRVDFSKAGTLHFTRDLLYKTSGSHLVVLNGKYSMEHSTVADDLTMQVTEVSEGKHDPFSLLNAANALEEIRITSGTKSPVFIYHITTHAVSHPRIRVKVDTGDTINIIEKIIPTSELATLTNSYTQFEVASNAFAYHTRVQNYHAQAYTHETTVADAARDAHFYNNTFSFAGALIRNNLTINLNGENGEGHMYGLFIPDGSMHVDNNTSVDHTVPNCYSNELYKGILEGKSTGVFNGKIYVRQDAQKTNAFQSNNNILLSADATIHSKPQLEIWADDVKCSHGCTSGQMDEDAVFYLRARGIDEKSAKALILNAFATETLDHIGVQEVEDEVRSLINEALAQ